jgi:hypothetical protein
MYVEIDSIVYSYLLSSLDLDFFSDDQSICVLVYYYLCLIMYTIYYNFVFIVNQTIH